MLSKSNYRIGTRKDDDSGTLYIFGPNKFRASTFTKDHGRAKAQLASIIGAGAKHFKIKTVEDCLDLHREKIVKRGNCGRDHDYSTGKLRDYFGSIQPKDITPQLIAGFVKLYELEGSKLNTANKRLKTLKAAINYAHQISDKTLQLPHCNLTLSDVRDEVRERVLTEQEISKIYAVLEEKRYYSVSGKDTGKKIDYTNPNTATAHPPQPWPFWFKFAVKTAIATSARKGAILDLTWDRIKGGIIDLENPDLKGKRKGRAKVKASEKFLALIEEARENAKGKYVIADWNGSRIGVKRLGNYMIALRAQAGLGDDVTFHTFRHTTATHMVNDAVDIMEVSKRLGHKSVAVTERVYNHHKPEFQKKSANSIDSLL
mgnify:FL=1